jgi:hypothetical protein
VGRRHLDGWLTAALALGSERVVADGQPSDDPTHYREAGGDGHRDVEAMGHRGRLIEALATQVGHQW